MINDLRLVIQDRLESIKTENGIREISYQIASNKKMFPHIVYDFTSITPTDMGRADFVVDIHIWGKDPFECFSIMDAVRDLFAFWNAPDALDGQTILPTFYELSGGAIDDPDKSIVHLVLRLQAHAYEADATDAGMLGKE